MSFPFSAFGAVGSRNQQQTNVDSFDVGKSIRPRRDRSPPTEGAQTKIILNGVEYIKRSAVDNGEYRSDRDACSDRQPQGSINRHAFGETNSARGAISAGPKGLLREREGAFSIDSHKNYSEANRADSRGLGRGLMLDSPANPWHLSNRGKDTEKKELFAKLSKKI